MAEPYDIIVLFTRYPEAGKCKTRLIPALGASRASSLHKKLVKKIMTELTSLKESHDYLLEIHYDGASLDSMQSWLGNTFSFRSQCRGDLGNRMQTALNHYLGADGKILLIGSDCPELDNKILSKAFFSLDSSSLVFGPAFDGGYYLIGMQRKLAPKSIASLFNDISWGSSFVLRSTLEKAKKCKLPYHLLETLHDIDTPDDLRHINNHPYFQ